MPDSIDVAIWTTMRKLSHVEGRGGDMERDMELVRKILRAIKAKTDLAPVRMTVEGYDAAVVSRHLVMLHGAGYIDGMIWHGDGEVLVVDLSWNGHEFAGALISDEGTWEKVKAAFGPEKLATVPLKMIETVATQALTAWGMKQMGL
jgi:hypothetical protein